MFLTLPLFWCSVLPDIGPNWPELWELLAPLLSHLSPHPDPLDSPDMTTGECCHLPGSLCECTGNAALSKTVEESDNRRAQYVTQVTAKDGRLLSTVIKALGTQRYLLIIICYLFWFLLLPPQSFALSLYCIPVKQFTVIYNLVSLWLESQVMVYIFYDDLLSFWMWHDNANPVLSRFVLQSSFSFSDGPICRICHEGGNGEGLLSPCDCTGTLGTVHKSCLEKWLSSSNTSYCELCHTEFTIERRPRPLTEVRHQWLHITASTVPVCFAGCLVSCFVSWMLDSLDCI